MALVAAPRRAWICGLILVAASYLLFAANAAYAAPAPGLAVGEADYAAGTVVLSVPLTSEVARVRFEDSHGMAVDVPAASSAAAHAYRLAADASVWAKGYGADGTLLWQTAQVALSPAAYRPGAAYIELPRATIVGEAPVFSGRGDPRTRSMTLRSWGHAIWSGGVVPAADGTFVLPQLPLAYGRAHLTLVASNGFGQSNPGPMTVAFNLGRLPSYAHFTLVDKSDLQLYVIRHGVVQRVFPIAIGMPGAPTPTGTFWLGAPQRMNARGVWGVLRVPLLRRTRWGYRGTSYYIHGTNDPDSIGTMASHGCVRLYNRNAIVFEKVTGRERAVIRR